ncbi:hypothetical protein BBO_07990 [Beauveria brongniartii RCEF 3172]|uniref:Uncharacterized protein n=1 Tax=Beauveria brongniartii RCEF 3172 TaxID=1081107 RepID=A0A166YAZ8_9HYPO|nr:hypothetical protein BBO_07990 [Beauveria brongniartii RCEF 3172]
MEQGIIDWTAFLEDDDETWFLPDPPPAGVELIDAPLPYLGSDLSCDEMPECSADCFWGRSNFNGPFMGFEERVAALGHFGMGFPEGHLPETVPGSFTGTEVEHGRSTLVDDGILNMGRSRDSSDDCTRDDSAGILPENESQIELSIGTLDNSDAVQQGSGSSELAFSETGQDARPAPASSKKDSVGGESVTDVDRTDHELPNAVACPNNIADGECLEYQGTSDHEDVEKHSGYIPEERDDWVPEPAVEMKRGPKKYQRKRKIQKSSECFGQDQCDSDSDYTPEPRQKKRARITTPPARKRQSVVAKKPNVWFAKGRSKSLKKATLADNVDKGTAVDYAPIANKAQFAASAKRARFALEATTIRRQSGISDENVENAPYTFSQLYKEFQRAKQQTIGKGSNRNIQQVVFADRAVDAEFAEFAVAAEAIISVG